MSLGGVLAYVLDTSAYTIAAAARLSSHRNVTVTSPANVAFKK
ncbi:hypothetical protein FDUTEX481_02062 [Tolypothrix sp. PCC 7601]|nr:hypothetical protein [Tolypothrix sp. LEGE 11397]EKF04383.1 hypothetical protein FDUTEX481_02062 [Tolypothrix sp. PCC 7601]